MTNLARETTFSVSFLMVLLLGCTSIFAQDSEQDTSDSNPSQQSGMIWECNTGWEYVLHGQSPDDTSPEGCEGEPPWSAPKMEDYALPTSFINRLLTEFWNSVAYTPSTGTPEVNINIPPFDPHMEDNVELPCSWTATCPVVNIPIDTSHPDPNDPNLIIPMPPGSEPPDPDEEDSEEGG